MMDLNQQKEQFSFAYVRAVAATAGYGVSQPAVDDDSIDLQIASRSTAGTIKRPRLEIQVKCTADEPLAEDQFAFPLKIKNYNDLRDPNILVPRLLVVVRVPKDVRDWVACSDEQLLLRHCGYWVSLRGMAETPNTQTVSVSLPRNQPFDAEGLGELMSRIGEGGLP